MERGGISFSSYAYSHPACGPAEAQRQLLDDLLQGTAPRRKHQQQIFDDFWEHPLPELLQEFGVKTLICAEAPLSVFGVLPVVLQYGYRYIVLAHEMSADAGNLLWERTGEQVHHHWGKSLEAGLLLNSYIQRV